MKKVLIIRGSAIGDIIECLPVASALKNIDNECEIHWLVRKNFKTLLEGNRFIDKVLCFEDYKDLQFRIAKRIYKKWGMLDKIADWLRFSRANKLKSECYDIVINLHRKEDARMFSIICGASKSIIAPYLNSLDNVYDSNHHRIIENLESLTLFKKDFDVNKFVRKGLDYGWNFDEREIANTERILEDNGVKDNYIVFVLSTTWESKNYPIDNWIELTNYLASQKRKIVFIGDNKDKSIFNKVKASVKSDVLIDLTGKTSLREMILVLSKAAVVVGGDTGPLHIASSLNVKTITMMNPTFPDKYAPFGENGVVLTASYPCKNCHMVKCPKGICCMRHIAPVNVLKEIEKIIN